MNLSKEVKVTIILFIIAGFGTVLWYFITRNIEKSEKECDKLELEISTKFERLNKLRGQLKTVDFDTQKELFQRIVADSSVTNAQLKDLKIKRNSICD